MKGKLDVEATFKGFSGCKTVINMIQRGALIDLS